MPRKTKAQLHRERMDLCYAEAQKVWDSRKCPRCGGGLHLNNAILGWVQCDRLGAPGFRRDPDGPSCDYQTFIKWGN